VRRDFASVDRHRAAVQYRLIKRGKLVLCLIASIVLMTIDYRFAHLDTTRTVLTTTLYPLQSLVDLPSRTYRWARRRWLNALP
jgi:hypothetical protein